MLIQLIIIQVITFVGLILVLRMLFYRQLATAINRLKRLHEENLIREGELKKELEESKKLKEAELEKARIEAEEIIKEAKERSEKVLNDSRESAKKEAQRIIGRATQDLRKLEDDLKSKYQEEALDFSVELLRLTFSKFATQALQHELLNELIEELSKLEKEKFTVKAASVKIICACALSAAERERLLKILNDKLGYEVTIEESIDQDILAGFILNIGTLIVDGSLKNKLRKAIPYIKKVGK